MPKVVAQQAIKTLAKFFICMKKEILICSDCNYDNLIAEIYIDDKYIALVSYDDNGNFFVETPTVKPINEDMITHKVDYNVFIELLEEAKNSLK